MLTSVPVQSAAQTLPRQVLDQLSDTQLREPLEARYEQLIERARARRADHGSTEETELFSELLDFGLRLLRGLGSQAAVALRSDVNV
jgi:hypothetical protein